MPHSSLRPSRDWRRGADNIDRSPRPRRAKSRNASSSSPITTIFFGGPSASGNSRTAHRNQNRPVDNCAHGHRAFGQDFWSSARDAVTVFCYAVYELGLSVRQACATKEVTRDPNSPAIRSSRRAKGAVCRVPHALVRRAPVSRRRCVAQSAERTTAGSRRSAEEDRRDGRGTARVRDSRGVVGVIDQYWSAPRRQSLARPHMRNAGIRSLSRLEISITDAAATICDILSRSQCEGLMRIKSYPVGGRGDMNWA